LSPAEWDGVRRCLCGESGPSADAELARCGVLQHVHVSGGMLEVEHPRNSGNGFVFDYELRF